MVEFRDDKRIMGMQMEMEKKKLSPFYTSLNCWNELSKNSIHFYHK